MTPEQEQSERLGDTIKHLIAVEPDGRYKEKSAREWYEERETARRLCGAMPSVAPSSRRISSPHRSTSRA